MCSQGVNNMNKRRLINFLFFCFIFFLGGFSALSSQDISSKYPSIILVWFFLIYMASIKDKMQISNLDLGADID